MLSDYVRSRVLVSPSGYKWVTTKNGLRILLQAAEHEEARPCDPFQMDHALFLKFAQLEKSEEAILSFANRYSDDLDPSPLRDFEHWCHCIDEVRDGVQLWRAVDSKDQGLLSHVIQWKGGRLVGLAPIAKGYEFEGDISKPLAVLSGRVGGYRNGDLITPAIDLFDLLLKRARFELAPVRNEVGRFTFRVCLEDLVAVMWAQLAFHAAESSPCRACQECGQLFSLLDNRDDRSFCSDACRVKAYRVRRKRAEAMRTEGKTLREISKELNSDVDTIKKWLQPKGDDDAKKKKRPRRG